MKSSAHPLMKDTPSDKTVSKTISEYGKKLYAFIRKQVPTAEDTEDIIQEVWYQLSKLEDIDNFDSLSGWLYSVSRNKITDFHRKKKNDHLEDYTYEEDGISEIRDLLLLDTSNDPELAAFKELFWETLLEALEELPENQKDAFVLNELEDYSLQEIADMFDTNIKTIISRKRYAVKHLKKRLEFIYNELN